MIEIVLFWLGLILGSFLNVCIWRIQRDESIVFPRSRCPHCSHMLAWYDNIPVLSFLWLRARCRYCHKPISFRYPLVELISAFLLVGLWRRWMDMPTWCAGAYVASAVLLVIALIDWDTFLIPDVLSLGLLAMGILFSPFNPLFQGALLWKFFWSLVGGAGGFIICWGIAEIGELVFKKEAMGGGDIKLLAAVGAWTGLLGAFDCIMLSSFLGALYGVPLLLGGKLKRQDPIPFGPFLSAAAIFNFFYLIPFGFPFIQ